LRYALDDLKVARSIETLGSSHWRACAYHSQQVVEKALKGYLAHHQVRFPKTHNISELIELVAGTNSVLAKKLTPARRLTKFAIEYRYPDAASRPMTRAKARSATKVAEKAYEAVSATLRTDPA
jgi:HEPN domain-containing protein